MSSTKLSPTSLAGVGSPCTPSARGKQRAWAIVVFVVLFVGLLYFVASGHVTSHHHQDADPHKTLLLLDDGDDQRLYHQQPAQDEIREQKNVIPHQAVAFMRGHNDAAGHKGEEGKALSSRQKKLLVSHPPWQDPWLEMKSQEDDVFVLPSGMLFKIIRRGTGAVSPTLEDTCKVHYRGTLTDGKEFDSSYKRHVAAQFRPSQVIAGWKQALQLMREGDKWEVYIPSFLGYGPRGAPPAIPADATLSFTIELIEVLPKMDGSPVGKPAAVALEQLQKEAGLATGDLFAPYDDKTHALRTNLLPHENGGGVGGELSLQRKIGYMG